MAVGAGCDRATRRSGVGWGRNRPLAVGGADFVQDRRQRTSGPAPHGPDGGSTGVTTWHFVILARRPRTRGPGRLVRWGEFCTKSNPPTARPAGGTGAGTDSALTHAARPNRGPGPHAKARDTPGPAFSTYVYFRKAIILPRKQAHRMTGRSYRKRIRRGHPNAHRRSSTENHWSRCAPR